MLDNIVSFDLQLKSIENQNLPSIIVSNLIIYIVCNMIGEIQND